MLIGFALIIVAVFLCCALLFRLSIYALPLFVAFLAGSATYRSGSGIIAALAAAAIAAIILLAVAQFALAFAKSDLTRAVVGIAFAAPAAVAGYHAVHGIAAATMPTSAWQFVVSLLGATIIAAASWTQWAAPALSFVVFSKPRPASAGRGWHGQFSRYEAGVMISGWLCLSRFGWGWSGRLSGSEHGREFAASMRLGRGGPIAGIPIKPERGASPLPMSGDAVTTCKRTV